MDWETGSVNVYFVFATENELQLRKNASKTHSFFVNAVSSLANKLHVERNYGEINI